MSSHTISKPPVSAEPVASVPGSSGSEPSSQTFAKPSTSHGGSFVSADSSFTGQNFPSYSTGAETFTQSQEQYGESFPLSFTGPPKVDDIPLSETHDSEEYSGSVSESEESTESPQDKQEITEELNYRETIRSVRSFMGWDHIPTFESDLSEPDKSNNPWKGKNPKTPSRISVAMPPDDWLCQKLERLNCIVAEGYPSRSQDSASLKKDQFVKVPKSQSRWYQMHLIKPDGPHRPGRSVFSWHNAEAKVNSQFP